MPEAPTARDYVKIDIVHATCLRCDHAHELDLAALVKAGQGDTPLIRLRLRCSKCGMLGHTINMSGQSYGLADK
jgi:hypothetical protein